MSTQELKSLLGKETTANDLQNIIQQERSLRSRSQSLSNLSEVSHPEASSDQTSSVDSVISKSAIDSPFVSTSGAKPKAKQKIKSIVKRVLEEDEQVVLITKLQHELVEYKVKCEALLSAYNTLNNTFDEHRNHFEQVITRREEELERQADQISNLTREKQALSLDISELSDVSETSHNKSRQLQYQVHKLEDEVLSLSDKLTNQEAENKRINALYSHDIDNLHRALVDADTKHRQQIQELLDQHQTNEQKLQESFERRQATLLEQVGDDKGDRSQELHKEYEEQIQDLTSQLNRRLAEFADKELHYKANIDSLEQKLSDIDTKYNLDVVQWSENLQKTKGELSEVRQQLREYQLADVTTSSFEDLDIAIREDSSMAIVDPNLVNVEQNLIQSETDDPNSGRNPSRESSPEGEEEIREPSQQPYIMDPVKHLPSYSGERTEQVTAHQHLLSFKDFLKIQNIAQDGEWKLKYERFGQSLKGKARDWFEVNSYKGNNFTKEKFEEICNKFLQRFSKFGSEELDRYSYWQRLKWDMVEPIDEFAEKIRQLGNELGKPDVEKAIAFKNSLPSYLAQALIFEMDFETLVEKAKQAVRYYAQDPVAAVVPTLPKPATAASAVPLFSMSTSQNEVKDIKSDLSELKSSLNELTHSMQYLGQQQDSFRGQRYGPSSYRPPRFPSQHRQQNYRPRSPNFSRGRGYGGGYRGQGNGRGSGRGQGRGYGQQGRGYSQGRGQYGRGRGQQNQNREDYVDCPIHPGAGHSVFDCRTIQNRQGSPGKSYRNNYYASDDEDEYYPQTN